MLFWTKVIFYEITTKKKKKSNKTQKQSSRGVLKKGVTRNFAKFMGKQLCQSFFLMAQVFSCEFCNISKNTFSYRTSPVVASENGIKNKKATKTEYSPCSTNTILEKG